jgi:hypothetical protein
LRRDLVRANKKRLCRFYQCADALGTQRLLHLLAILNDRHLLQVGVEGAVGSPIRERNVVTEGGGFSTMSAFCHFLYSFLTECLI